jgi:5-methylcytosine-specific restriction endonuclease McrA
VVDPIPSKTCTKCGTEKLVSEFRAKPKSHPGVVAACKACESAWQREYYLKVREKRLEQSATWFAANRERKNQTSREWYRANRDAAAEYQRAYNAARPGNRARLVREWRDANPERDRANWTAWRQANRDRLRELGRQQYAANPEKFINKAHRRRAQVAGAPVGSVDLEALWTGSCGLCGEPIDPDLKHPDPMSKSVDHIIPLSKGGAHEQTNLQWAHLFCNVSKGARLPEAG